MTPYLLDYVASLGHAVFTNGEYNLNIIGIRSADDSANTFNDRICVVYKDDQGPTTEKSRSMLTERQFWSQANTVELTSSGGIAGSTRHLYRLAAG